MGTGKLQFWCGQRRIAGHARRSDRPDPGPQLEAVVRTEPKHDGTGVAGLDVRGREDAHAGLERTTTGDARPAVPNLPECVDFGNAHVAPTGLQQWGRLFA